MIAAQGRPALQTGSARPARARGQGHPRPGRRAPRPAGRRSDRDRRAREPLTPGDVELPTAVQPPAVTGRRSGRRAATPSAALSAPVTRRRSASAHLQLEPKQLARMLQLPDEQGRQAAARRRRRNTYFAQLDHLVGKPAQGASFAAYGDHVIVDPCAPASRSTCRTRPPPCSRRRSRPAAASRSSSVTPVTSAARPPTARRWASPAWSASYETFYGGDPNRIHNVELVAHLVDDKLIAPGRRSPSTRRPARARPRRDSSRRR